MYLHADAAHHLMRGRKVTVSGEGSSMARFQRGVKQIFNVSCIHPTNKTPHCSSPYIYYDNMVFHHILLTGRTKAHQLVETSSVPSEI